MDNVFILGSCVTRDIFRVVKKEDKPITYYARTSFISQMSPPLELHENQIHLNSQFQRRMVIQDFRKTFLEEIKTKKPDVLIIDFIDERFDLLQHGQSYVTKSKEFDEGKVSLAYHFVQLSRNDESTHQLWENSCLRFIERLSQVFSGKVYLHEAYWAKEYLDDERNVQKFTYQKAIDNSNSLLKRYYDFFKANMPEAEVLSAPCMADSRHTWGLSAYHYTDDYYCEIYKQIVS